MISFKQLLALLVNMNNLEAVFIFICVLFIRYQHVFKLCWESLIRNVTWVKDGKLVYKDDDDGWGSYVGEVDQRSRERNGYGKMTFDNGSYYEGGFVNNKYEGDKCVYRWPNGDEYEGGFKDGMFHGVGIYCNKADGFVEYRKSEMALIVDRLQWSDDGKKAYQASWVDPRILEMRRSGRHAATGNGKQFQNPVISSDESWTKISLDKAKELAKKVYQLSVPEHVSSTSEEKALGFGKAVAEHAVAHVVVKGIFEVGAWVLGG